MSQRIGKKKRNLVGHTELPTSPLAPPPAEPAGMTQPSYGVLHNPLTHMLLILFAGLAIYVSVLGAPFVFDDIGCIRENPAITDFRHLADHAGTATG